MKAEQACGHRTDPQSRHRALFGHSGRVFIFVSLKGGYLSCSTSVRCIIDPGPTEHYWRTDERFAVGGADLAQDFLLDHGLGADESHQIEMSAVVWFTQQK